VSDTQAPRYVTIDVRGTLRESKENKRWACNNEGLKPHCNTELVEENLNCKISHNTFHTVYLQNGTEVLCLLCSIWKGLA